MDKSKVNPLIPDMKRISLFASLLFSFNCLIAQNVAGTASDRNGVVTYIETVPGNPYRHLGTVDCSAMAPDKFDLMLDHMIVKQARKVYPEFDALIFRPGFGLCKADVVQFYRDPKAKKARPTRGEAPPVNPAYKISSTAAKDGVYLFLENNPTVDFTLLGKLELPATFRTNDFEALMKEMIRIAKATYPDHNGIVFATGSELRRANIIRINTDNL
jgi:hypothetical protein